MLLCAITSRILLAGTEAERSQKLVALAGLWADSGIDFIQIREKDLDTPELLQLSASIVQAVRRSGSSTRVLINGDPASSSAIALQSGADGVHLPGRLGSAELMTAIRQIRDGWKSSRNSLASPVISVSCHTIADVHAARAAGAALALFAPVFEKSLPGSPAIAGQGLEFLREACAAARQPAPQPEIPVLALGGITLENAADCMGVGAAGIAAIRMFLNSDEGQSWRSLLVPKSLRQVPVLPQT